MTENSTPRVLAISTDLFFMPQIEAAAKAAGLGFDWLDGRPNAAEFAARLSEQPTALVVLDLTTQQPWQEWLAAIAASDVRWLAFGPHTDAKLLAAARKAGVQKVVARSQFAQTLRQTLADIHPEQ